MSNDKKYGTQHHSALVIGERYREPIRRTFRKLCVNHPKVKKEFLLNLAVKACKDALGPEVVVPSAFVFGKFPSLRSFLGPEVPRTTLVERAQADLTVGKIVAEAQTKSRLKCAIKRQSSKM